MRDLKFKIMPEKEGCGVPIAVAGNMMVDIQSVVLHIGEYQVANELRLQGDVPEELLKKFILIIGKGGEYSVSSAVHTEDEFSGNLLDLSSEILESTLDTLERGTSDEWYLETFPDSKYRSKILKDILNLSNHLEGYILMYGVGEANKEFLGVNHFELEKFIEGDLRTIPGTLEGIISCSDGESYVLSTGKSDIKLIFNGVVTPAEAELYCGEKACIVTGMISYSETGDITHVDTISEVDSFPTIIFKRIVTEERDLQLLNPVSVDIEFDKDTNLWTLKSDLLGITISKGTWDEAVLEFHNYFIFLWELYAEKAKDKLSDEERDIREYLLSLMPKKA